MYVDDRLGRRSRARSGLDQLDLERLASRYFFWQAINSGFEIFDATKPPRGLLYTIP